MNIPSIIAHRHRIFAEELRTLATEQMTAQRRDHLLRIAANYEQTAASFEAFDQSRS